MKTTIQSGARRKIIQATAASLLLPTACFAEAERKKVKYGILGQKAPELEASLKKIELLEDRIRVLERIVTENKRDIGREIDNL